jgi:cytoskeletal protein RodZ
MSKTGKVIMWIVIVIIVVGGIWWWVISRSNTAMAPSGDNTPSVSANATSTSYPQGDSDQSINQDMASMNTQMNGLNSDNASVTQSLNDQPVQQAE